MSNFKQQKKLTQETKNFILSLANNNLLTGKNTYGLPHSNISNNSITFTATIVGVSTPTDYCNLLIIWYQEYASNYGLDPNILVAQAYQESKLKTWEYSRSGALGIAQFIPSTGLADVFFNDFITDGEKALLRAGGVIGENSNRQKLHQNIMNNPEILIKAQAAYMQYISRRNNNLTSSTLFAYNRSGSLRSSSYPEAIKRCKTPQAEGVQYVDKIFKVLSDSCGYEKMDLTKLDPRSPAIYGFR